MHFWLNVSGLIASGEARKVTSNSPKNCDRCSVRRFEIIYSNCREGKKIHSDEASIKMRVIGCTSGGNEQSFGND